MANELTDDLHNRLDQDFLKSQEGLFLLWALGLYQRELDIQAKSRTRRSLATDFYDGDQLTDDEIAEYERRNQTPRVFNEIKPTVDWLLGGERRTRADWSVLPRTEDDSKPSIHKMKLIKYIDDINNARWHRSEAYSDALKSGEGWTAVEYLPNLDGDMQITLTHEHWRYVFADSKSRRRDMSDMQYIFRVKIMALDELVQHFPDKRSELCNIAADMDVLEQDLINEPLTDFDKDPDTFRVGSMSLDKSSGERDGVRVYEMWYRQTERVELLRGEGSFNGEIYDKNNPDHQVLIQHYGFRVAQVVRQQMYCAMFTDDTLLYRQKSPYKHNRFPFVRRYAYIKDKDGTPRGVIDAVIDPQSDLNVRRNKALHMLSSNRVVMEDGAVEDTDELSEEVSRWDGIIKYKKGYKLDIVEGSDRANQQLNVGEQNSAFIRQISGVTGENRGMDTNATSGIAIQARQEQGTVISTVLTDMHSLAHKLEGELVLSLIEQFMDKPFQFRITADNLNDKAEFAKINDDAEPETNITKTQSDFVISERDYRTTMRQALSEQMMNTAGAIAQHTGNPELAVTMITSAIELQDLPDKERLIEGLRNASGLPPLSETDEERKQREQKEQQAAAEQQKQQQEALALQKRELTAKIAEVEARAEKAAADALYTKINGDLLKVRGVMEKLNALKTGIEAGSIAVQGQGVLPMVDQMLENLDELLNLDQDNAQSSAQASLGSGIPTLPHNPAPSTALAPQSPAAELSQGNPEIDQADAEQGQALAAQAQISPTAQPM